MMIVNAMTKMVRDHNEQKKEKTKKTTKPWEKENL